LLLDLLRPHPQPAEEKTSLEYSPDLQHHLRPAQCHRLEQHAAAYDRAPLLCRRLLLLLPGVLPFHFAAHDGGLCLESVQPALLAQQISANPLNSAQSQEHSVLLQAAVHHQLQDPHRWSSSVIC
jgi:hypothetical protein